MSGLIFSIFFLLSGASALIGYDCGAKQLNVTTLSLKDLGECEIPNYQPNITQRYIQRSKSTSTLPPTSNARLKSIVLFIIAVVFLIIQLY